jgi:hypothetical protein
MFPFHNPRSFGKMILLAFSLFVLVSLACGQLSSPAGTINETGVASTIVAARAVAGTIAAIHTTASTQAPPATAVPATLAASATPEPGNTPTTDQPSPPVPTAIILPAGATPVAAGEWIATTDFGKLVFTVDATGTKITKLSYQFSKLTCGRTTNTGTMETSSEWPITNGLFAVMTSLDPGNHQTMNISGTYDAANQKFSGNWEEVSYGTTCSGTWEASAPK